MGLSKTTRSNVVVGLRFVYQSPIARKVIGPLKLSLGVKALLIVLCALISIIVAMVAGFMSHTAGSPVTEAVLYGGGAFTGCMMLCLMVLSALGAV